MCRHWNTVYGCYFTWELIIPTASPFAYNIFERRHHPSDIRSGTYIRKMLCADSTYISQLELWRQKRGNTHERSTHFQHKWLFVNEAALVRQSRLIKRVTDFAISRHITSKRGNSNLGSLWIYNVFSAATTFNRSCLRDW